VMVRGETNEAMDARLPDYRMIGHGNGFLTVRAIKRQIDGALGSHGAWLLQPYADLPTGSGMALEPPEVMRGTAEVALRHGFQLATHAIGDRGNREALDLYERAFRQAGVEGAEQRWRIEHAQHVDPADVPRFAELGVIASMQGVHATSDGPWVPRRLGEARAERTSYLWRSLLDAGVVVTNGTDVPVEDISPIASYYASVTRHMADCNRFFPEQAMTRMEALRSYTIDNAYAAFEEDEKGSLTPGKRADIVVLSRNILTVPEEEIRDAQIDYTIVGGEVRYHRRGAR
jgi:predicted amidohydrolase YtcJ